MDSLPQFAVRTNKFAVVEPLPLSRRTTGSAGRAVGLPATATYRWQPDGGFRIILSVATELGQRAILDSIAADQQPADPRDALLAELACHPSLKAGDALSTAAAEKLLARLGECEQPFACPHGRPTVCRINEATLAAGFDRGSTRLG